MKIQGKVVLVTGAAKRVGRVIALTLAQREAQMALHYRHSKKEAQQTLQELRQVGAKAYGFKAELTEPSQAKRLVNEVVKTFGRLDVLINSASVFFRTPFGGVREKDWDITLNSNLKAPFFLSQEAAKTMRKTGGGKIINIADWAAFRPYKGYLPYCVSKAGLVCLTQGLARTLAPQIAVNAIAPGPVMIPEDLSPRERAEILKNTPLKRFGSPQDIANAVVFLLEGSDFITGSTLVVDGGRLIA